MIKSVTSYQLPFELSKKGTLNRERATVSCFRVPNRGLRPHQLSRCLFGLGLKYQYKTILFPVPRSLLLVIRRAFSFSTFYCFTGHCLLIFSPGSTITIWHEISGWR